MNPEPNDLEPNLQRQDHGGVGGVHNVFFDTFGKPHSLYHELLESPPDNTNFVLPKSIDRGLVASFRKMTVPKIFAAEVLNGFLPPQYMLSLLSKTRTRPSNCDLTYSTGHLMLRNERWIVDCEHLGQFVGYNPYVLRFFQRSIERNLASSNCRRILPWSKMAYDTIIRNIEGRNVRDKLEIVRLARRTTPVSRGHHSKMTILFVGSVNFPSILTPSQRYVLEGISRFSGLCSFAAYENFESKGGRQVFDVFSQLKDEYDDVHLIARVKVPPDLKSKYAGDSHVKIIEESLPAADMERLFLEADIFLFPSHMTPGMAFLDAMNYELPIVTIDACNNSEIVKDGKNGFVCGVSSRIPYFLSNGIPAGNTFEHINAIRKRDDAVIACLVAQVKELIENPSIRLRMGKEGRRQLETGENSIRNRNAALKRIIEESVPR